MKLKFLNKPCNSFSHSFTGTYQKPATCPHCGFGTDATFIDRNIYTFNDNKLLIGSCKCTSCGKNFFFACEKTSEENANMVCMYPSISFSLYKNEILTQISPRFIDMYNQALQSEFVGNIELAAIGYRSALEILIKDYAVSELKVPESEVVNKKLFDAIKTYLNQDELISTADVVRILGNDYTHYQRKYPQHEFDLLKGYMEIFLKQIEICYMIKHPPVSRIP